jgi:hypothetical protein
MLAKLTLTQLIKNNNVLSQPFVRNTTAESKSLKKYDSKNLILTEKPHDQVILGAHQYDLGGKHAA